MHTQMAMAPFSVLAHANKSIEFERGEFVLSRIVFGVRPLHQPLTAHGAGHEQDTPDGEASTTEAGTAYISRILGRAG